MKKLSIKNLILKYKKTTIMVFLVCILGGMLLVKLKSSNEPNLQIINNTVKLKKGDINNSITVNGTIKSAEVSNVSSSITAKVKSINVKVGDIVKAGDIICILDDSDIVKDIEDKTKAIEEEKKNLEDNYNKLLSQLETLKNTQAQNLSSQNNIIDVASNNLKNANSELSSYENEFNNIKNTYNVMLSGIKDKQNRYDNAEKNKDKYYEEWIKSGGKVNSDEYKKYIGASEDLENKRKELEDSKVLYDYENISNKYNEALEKYNEKLSARDSAKSQYDEAILNRTNLINSNNTEIDNLQSNISDVKKQIDKISDNDELKELKENLDKTVLKAETSGKITELKVNVGSVPDGVIATIQSTDNLILEVNIPEYDIKKVSAGMKAKINSDTAIDKVDGELLRIAPVANEGDKGGFTAEISIANGSDLFIGTAAKAEIIISSKNNVIIAPIDSIKNIDSNPVIVVIDSNGEVSEIPVIVGERNDYYAEISGDGVKEGVEIEAEVDSDTYDENSQGEMTSNESN